VKLPFLIALPKEGDFPPKRPEGIKHLSRVDWATLDRASVIDQKFDWTMRQCVTIRNWLTILTLVFIMIHGSELGVLTAMFSDWLKKFGFLSP
jgi:hypothetical protein